MSAHYVLVGSGIAALSAAESIREADHGARITLISAEATRFYSRPALAYLLDRSIHEDQLWIRSAEQEESLQLNRLHGTAVQVRAAEHEVILHDGRTVRFDRLLLATGAVSTTPEFAGAELNGVLQLDGLDGARSLIARTRNRPWRAPRAIVIGGGSTALEIVEGLHERGVETHYFLRGERYWSRVLDPLESQIVARRLAAQGVRLHQHTEIACAEGRKGMLEAVITNTGRRLPCDMLAVAVGVRPRTELAIQAGLHCERGIITNTYLHTSAADVFAAGDVAQVRDRSGTAELDTLWQSALQQGRAAGYNLAGRAVEYHKRAALNVTRLAGITTTIMGSIDGGGDDDPDLLTLTRGQSERWHADAADWTIRAQHGIDRVRLQIGRRHVSGAIVMGDQTVSTELGRLIDARVDISPIREQLEQHPDDAIKLLLDYHRGWQQAAHARPY